MQSYCGIIHDKGGKAAINLTPREDSLKSAITIAIF
jgi:hypothetical protein